jgi:hypothetical protein
MILKKQEKDGIIKAMYNSSNVVASIYNSNNNDLEIIFKSGSKYRYTGVSKSDYMRFEIADSQGKVFESYIKKYPTTKLENVDIKNLLIETTSLKQQEHDAIVAAKKERLIKTMKGIILLADGGKQFVDNLDRLKNEIDEYVNKIKEEI